jgi:hypothetical protein
LKQAGEIAGPPSELQLRGFQFPLSLEHRLNTPNVQRHNRGNEVDSGGRKQTPKEGNRGLNPALVKSQNSSITQNKTEQENKKKKQAEKEESPERTDIVIF